MSYYRDYCVTFWPCDRLLYIYSIADGCVVFSHLHNTGGTRDLGGQRMSTDLTRTRESRGRTNNSEFIFYNDTKMIF